VIGESGQLIACGVTHRSSSLEQRESLQIGNEELRAANVCLGGLPGVMESLILSTCNRVEFYCVLGGQPAPLDLITEFYRCFRGTDSMIVRDLFVTRRGTEAASHLFRVAAGVDSMVLGETQILGQVKDAYSTACEAKSTGKVIHHLFHEAFRVGKQVRTNTDLGKGACSVSTAAVEMLKEQLSSLERPSILFVGVNQMVALASSKLAGMDGCRLIFANRSPEKAAVLAARYGAESCGLDRLTGLIAEADVVISCTSSPEPVITRRMLLDQARSRCRGKCILVDLAIPRDIDYPQKCGATYEVFDLEDVKRFAETQQVRRIQAIPQAEEIIDNRLGAFARWYELLGAGAAPRDPVPADPPRARIPMGQSRCS
jgi:glutamyl-tRNA reductase